MKKSYAAICKSQESRGVSTGWIHPLGRCADFGEAGAMAVKMLRGSLILAICLAEDAPMVYELLARIHNCVLEKS